MNINTLATDIMSICNSLDTIPILKDGSFQMTSVVVCPICFIRLQSFVPQAMNTYGGRINF